MDTALLLVPRDSFHFFFFFTGPLKLLPKTEQSCLHACVHLICFPERGNCKLSYFSEDFKGREPALKK